VSAGGERTRGRLVEVRVLGPEGVKLCGVDDIPGLLGLPDTIVWVDVPTMDEPATRLLSDLFGFHPRAIEDCARRNPVPKVHLYPRAVFVVLHAPEPGRGGHIHYVELDQFVGPNWLLTVHGPMDSEVTLDAAYVETRSIARKLESARLRPDRADELSGAVVTALIGRLREFLTELTHESWNLERQVTAGHVGDPEQFLEELFGVRHGLLAARTVAVLSREVFGRMARLSVFGAAGAAQVDDLEDQLRRLAAVADSQREYLHGVIEFYQTRIGTKMTIAAERLAVIAAVTLPVTALSSIVGMNVIVNEQTRVAPLVLLLALMTVMSLILLVWTHRKGWW
jgi:magnesium transporter